MHRPSSSSSTEKQAPSHRGRLCCPSRSSGTTSPSATLPAGTRLHGAAAYTRPSLPGQPTAGPGPGRASPAPASTLRPFRSLYPGEFLTAAHQALRGVHGLRHLSPGSAPPCPLTGHKFTRRQDSRDAKDRSLARPPKGLCRWAPTPGVSPRRRQPATRRPDAYRDRTSTGRRMRACVQIPVTSRHHLQTLDTQIGPKQP